MADIMSLFTIANLTRFAIPIIGGGLGALGGWASQETICGTLDKNKWMAPVFGTLIGLGLGALILFFMQ